MTNRRGMVRWYNPVQLLRTGIDIFVSEEFNARADPRLLEVQSGPDPDFAEGNDPIGEDGFWFDYMADTADGYAPTLAMARLLSRESLIVSGKALARGAFLVLGGDEVYPVASREAYEERLKAPFDAASADVNPEPAPHVYAIPGNHDWYDGLISFLRLFTGGSRGKEGRHLAIWRTCQTRSYFSIRLPGGWWLWGTDIHLEGDVDEPQRAFFARMLEKLEPGDRVIACTPEPDWILEDESDNPDLPGRLELISEGLRERGATIPLQLSGDFHNYQRFDAKDKPNAHKIISGGGGAFLHPTHRSREPARTTYERSRVYPSGPTSFWLSFRCLLLGFLNPTFALTSAIFYLVFSWPLLRTESLADFVRDGGSSLFLGAMLAVACMFYADNRQGFRVWGGLTHGVAQVSLAYLSCRAVIDALGRPAPLAPDFFYTILAVALAGALVMPAILGLYLFSALNLFGFHANEAFSALRIQSHKNFLRFRIAPDGSLTIYALGLDRPGGEPRIVDELVLNGTEL